MTRRSFSIAALLMLIAITAVGSASIRAALGEDLPVASRLVGLARVIGAAMLAGAVVGTIFGLILAAWNRNDLPAAFGSAVGGFFLGAAAAAQCTVKVDWRYIFATPIVLVSVATLVAINSRRRSKARSANGVRSLL